MSRQTLPSKQYRWLTGELTSWQAEGLLSPEQGVSIRDRYEAPAEDEAHPHAWGVLALRGLAVFMFVLAVFLLISFNWEAIPPVGKVAGILLVIASVQGLGLYLRFGRGALLASELVLFLGCGLFGGGIFLIGQVFHINAHYPDAIWWWALGVLPFALCLDTILLHLLLVALLAIWASVEVLGFPWSVPWFFFPGFSWPNGAYSLPLLALPGLLWAYRKPSAAAVGLYVPLLVYWLVLLAIAWHLDFLSVFILGGLGALLLVIAEVHDEGSLMAIPYRLWGAVVCAGTLLVLSSSGFWSYDISHGLYPLDEARFLGAIVLLVLPAVLSLVGLLAVRRAPAAQREDRLRRLAIPVVTALVMAGLAFFALFSGDPQGVPSSAPFGHGYGGLWAGASLAILIANLALLALAVYLIRTGMREERGRPFAAGVLIVVVWAVVRYVDLYVWLGGMVGGALLFILCGIGLFAVAQFWARVRQTRQPAAVTVELQPMPLPDWIRGALDWFRAHQRNVLLAGVCFQLAVLLTSVAVEAVPYFVGKHVVLEVQPVDPRDLFRGDYVVLAYDVGRLPLPGGQRSAWEEGKPVYALIEPAVDGKHWHGLKLSWEKPTSGTFLAGKVEYGRSLGSSRITSRKGREGTGSRSGRAGNWRPRSAWRRGGRRSWCG
jgi:uncharacterized membrane protein